MDHTMSLIFMIIEGRENSPFKKLNNNGMSFHDLIGAGSKNEIGSERI